MVENETKDEDKTFFSKVVNKTLENGRVVQTHTIELKQYSGNKFCQITQDKMPYGDQPAKRTWITLDPSLKELRDVILEMYDSYDKLIKSK